MSGNALPLPVALSKPVPMVSDLDSQIRASLGADGTKYDPATQVGAYGFSGPQLAWGLEIGFTSSNSNTSQTVNGDYNVVIDDLIVDDNDFN
jgi:hypothetical protein